MVSKYVQDIRKIVGIDINQSSLGSPSLKASIGSKRGISYFNGDNQTTSNQSGVGGQTTAKPPSSGQVNNPDFNGGNYLNPGSTGSGPYDYDAGTIDADDDLLDNLPDLWEKDPNGAGNNPTNAGGTLNGISGLIDPKTGLIVDLRFDGMPRPPVDWLDEDTPGNEYERWELGTYWFAPASIGQNAPTAYTAALAARNLVQSDYTTLISATFENFPHAGGSVRWVFIWERPSDNDQVSFYAQDESCAITPNDACTIFNPIKYEADDRMQLVLGSGVWEINEKEAEADIIPSYTDNQHSRLDMKFGTDRNLAIIPTKNGGFILAETDTIGGTPLSDNNKLVNSFGKVIDYVSADMIQSYLP